MKVFLLFLFTIGAAQAAPTSEVLTEFFKDKTQIENPLELRDPFKSPPVKTGKRKIEGQRYNKTGQGEFTNIAEGSLSQINIYDIKVVGVMIGKERRAMILPNANSKDVIVIKEGAKLGIDNAEVKAILPGGIVLVEKIINVYGQEEYLETVIPISR